MLEADADLLDGIRCASLGGILAFRTALLSHQRNKIKQQTGHFEDIGAFDAPVHTSFFLGGGMQHVFFF